MCFFTAQRRVLPLLLLVLLSATAMAQQGYALKLRSGVEHFDPNLDRALQQAAPDASEASARYVRYVQFDPLPDAAAKARMQAEGLILHSYLPERTWVVSFPAGYALEGLRPHGVRSVMRIAPQHKLAPALRAEDWPAHALSGENGLMVRIEPLSGFAMPDEGRLAQLGLTWKLESVHPAFGYWTVHVDRNQLEALAALPAVRWIEAVPPAPTPDDDEARGLHRNNTLDNAAIPGAWGFNGDGVAIAIADDGGIGPHIDIKGRVTQQPGLSLGGSHGDMVTGIAMGAGNLNPRYRGMATHAYLYMYGISGYPHIADAVTNLTTRGVHVTSTSYSQGCNEYTTDTRFGDQQIRQNPTILHVFSAGNSSSSNCGYGATGYGNITGGYKQGKNVIATANLDDSDVRTSSSSRGPAEDGRIKPDISANGTNQMSTAQDNNYQVGGGTSAASPGIAGITAQLIHAYRSFNGGATPESPLLKATMLNTAEDLGNVGPDYEFGWGRINALRAVRALEEGRYLDATVGTGGSNSHPISVPAGTAEVRFMVYWLDWEGDPAAAKALVNDLNLTVNPPGGGTLLPYVLDPTPSVAALSAPATNGVDDLNNMEQVRVTAPASGTYTINVEGLAVPEGPQKYYVVWEFIQDQIEVTYPIGGEGFVPGELEKIRWDAYGNAGSFNVEYSTNGGASWTSIGTAAGSARFLNWTVPSVLSGQCLVRVTRGGQSAESWTSFTIAPTPANLTVVSACPASVDLSWDPVAGATGYEVYMLGATHMESQGTTTGTTFTVSGTNPVDSFWFAVRTLGSNGLAGRRTLAVFKPIGVFSCPVNEDVAMDQVSPAGGILLDCHDLSSIAVTLDSRNAGLNATGAYTVNYQVDGGTVTSAARPGLPIGGTDSYTFAGTLDFSAPGTYTLAAWVSYPLDENLFNDTIVSVVETLAGASTTVSLFTQDFDGMANCATTTNCEVTVCPLDDGWMNEANGSGDDIDWRVNAGSTASSSTGPTEDHTSGSGKYVYLEASSGCENVWASMVSPCIDLAAAGSPTLSYWYHMFGSTQGELHVDLFDGSTWIEDITPALSGDQGNAWIERTVDLSAYAGQIVNIRFRGMTGAGFYSDLALDDIRMFDLSVPPVPAFNASSNSVCIGEPVQFTDASSNAPSGWSWSFNPPTVTFVGGTNAGSQNPQVAFNALGSYDVTLVVSNAAGPSTLTETALVVAGNGSTLPIAEDLESFTTCSNNIDCGGTECPLDNGWANAANGTEDDVDWRVFSGSTVSTGTGPSLDANPGTSTGKYIYLETSGSCVAQEGLLLSPCLDLTSAVSPVFRFAYHMFGASMGSLHVDVDAGSGWVLDVVPAISGDQGNIWIYQDVDLMPYVGNSVRVRIRAITGTSYTSDVALDDFSITDAGSVCTAPTGLVALPSPTSVELDWVAVPGALQYNLQGRLSPAGGWRNRIMASNSLVQGGLNPGTTYDVRVRAQCADASITGFSSIVTFTTPSVKTNQAPFGESQLQPVPASSSVALQWDGALEAVMELRVLDAIGRVIDARSVQQWAGPNRAEWDVSTWPAGVYTVVLSTDGHAPVQHRLTVVH